MADHSDAPDPRTDITDLFVFQSPGDPDRSVLVLNVNPEAQRALPSFDSDASYELKIDTDGDLEADVAFHVLFDVDGGAPTASVYRSTGRAARGTGRTGEIVVRRALVSLGPAVHIATENGCRFFAGLRSDPWFADVEGVLNSLQFTGHDFFADRNVFGIVLEVPDDVLGDSQRIGIWARTMARVHGRVTQVDQMGRPLINAVYNPTPADQAEFNRTPPAQQAAVFLTKFAGVIRSFGYGEADARQLAAGLLPDVLDYDASSSEGYPNGRRLSDDILDLRIAEMTRGKVRTDGVGPHSDLLDEFPYLGAPHPASER